MMPGRKTRLHAAAAVSAGLLLGGCALNPSTLPSPAPEAWQRCELFFGQSIPGGGVVSAAEWQAFVDGEVTPRFPQGLTVLQAEGQWRNAQGGIDREASRVLVLLLPANTARGPLMDELRARYRERFRQEAVARACTAADVRF
jgi:hypothetical protein